MKTLFTVYFLTKALICQGRERLFSFVVVNQLERRVIGYKLAVSMLIISGARPLKESSRKLQKKKKKKKIVVKGEG